MFLYQDPENNDSEGENLNESKFDLNLGLKARDGKSDSKADQAEDDQSE